MSASAWPSCLLFQGDFVPADTFDHELQRIRERLEKLEAARERLLAISDEHSRRLETLENLPQMLAEIHHAIGRLEAKIEAQKTYSQVLQGILWLIVGGVLAAGFELFKK